MRSVTGVTIASFKLAVFLYAQSYNLTWILVASSSDLFSFSEQLWCGKEERACPSSSSQTRSIVPFAGRLLCWAWLHGSSPSSLTAGTHVGSGHLVHGSPWLDARTGRGKRSLLGSVAFPVVSSRFCFRACLERESGERGWREAGESLERESCARMHHPLYYIRLTSFFRTVLNYRNRKSSCCSLGVMWNVGTCSPGAPTHLTVCWGFTREGGLALMTFCERDQISRMKHSNWMQTIACTVHCHWGCKPKHRDNNGGRDISCGTHPTSQTCSRKETSRTQTAC